MTASVFRINFKAALVGALAAAHLAFCAGAGAGELSLNPSFAAGGISTRGASAAFIGFEAGAVYEFDDGFGAGIYGGSMQRPVAGRTTSYGQAGGLFDYRFIPQLAAYVKCGCAWMFVRVPDYYRTTIYGAAFGLGADYRLFVYENSIALTAGADVSLYVFDGEFYAGYYGKIGAAFVF